MRTAAVKTAQTASLPPMERGHVPAQGRRDRVARIRVIPFLLIPHLPSRPGVARWIPARTADLTPMTTGNWPRLRQREVALTGYAALAAARHPGLAAR
jgi:hypothetical protein